MEYSKQDNRKKAMGWWNSLSLEQQFCATIEHNDLIVGDRTRHPHTLTGSEIELIYNAEKSLRCNHCGSIKDGVETGICEHCGKFGKTELSVEQKVSIVSDCEEIIKATKILIALMNDCGLKNHVTFKYKLDNQMYELSFKKLNK